VAERRAPG